jgi:hypothetical protein
MAVLAGHPVGLGPANNRTVSSVSPTCLCSRRNTPPWAWALAVCPWKSLAATSDTTPLVALTVLPTSISRPAPSRVKRFWPGCFTNTSPDRAEATTLWPGTGTRPGGGGGGGGGDVAPYGAELTGDGSEVVETDIIQGDGVEGLVTPLIVTRTESPAAIDAPGFRGQVIVSPDGGLQAPRPLVPVVVSSTEEAETDPRPVPDGNTRLIALPARFDSPPVVEVANVTT